VLHALALAQDGADAGEKQVRKGVLQGSAVVLWRQHGLTLLQVWSWGQLDG